jgi:N-acetylglucosaminyl-diphospho-decaprenol L-rhamnosyltransferase
VGFVDVVVVSYNSSGELRGCVETLASLEGVTVTVVDNASSDGSLEVIADLRVGRVVLSENGGFGRGCNVGWRKGSAPYVLFLNPDARIDGASLERLATVLESNSRAGAVAPRITHDDGTLDYSQRRFPRLRSTYARAFFLHRVFPSASWTDELVRDPVAYESTRSPDWVSGACILVRRSVLEEIGGFDEGFFMYCEDIDLCRRIWTAGKGVLFEPDAHVEHLGGASAPRTGLLPVLAASRIRYARKHRSATGAFLERVGVALEATTHLLISKGGMPARKGHAQALRIAVSPAAES